MLNGYNTLASIPRHKSTNLILSSAPLDGFFLAPGICSTTSRIDREEWYHGGGKVTTLGESLHQVASHQLDMNPKVKKFILTDFKPVCWIVGTS